MKISDREIRAALHTALAARHADSLIVHEMRLRASQAVLDVAAIDENLHGYEIKSSRDNLTRLARQSDYYDRTCDFITLVSTNPKHVTAIPEHWGFAIVDGTNDKVDIDWKRNAERNVTFRVQDLLYILRSSELQRLLRANGQRGYASATKARLVDQALSLLGATTARAIAIEILRTRKTWSIRQLAVANETARLQCAIAQPPPRLSALVTPMF